MKDRQEEGVGYSCARRSHNHPVDSLTQTALGEKTGRDAAK
jgi:hypothetical protein